MKYRSNRQAAEQLGLAHNTLALYIRLGKVPAPNASSGGSSAYLWTEEEIEAVRKLLPKIANGRKTRYQKLKEKQKAPPRAAVPHKQKQAKSKKKSS